MMGLRDLVTETYGSDKDLKWDEKTKTASIGSAVFGQTINGVIMGYINNDGKMMVDSAVFANAVGLSGKYGSYNPSLSEDATRLALRSEYASSMLLKSQTPYLDPEKTYILEYMKQDIMLNINKTTMHVNMERGTAKDYILRGNSYSLAGWLLYLYEKQYDEPYWIGQGPIAAELFGHAAPHQLLTFKDRYGRQLKIPSTGLITRHTRVADIGDTMKSNPAERLLWDTLGNDQLFRMFISQSFID